IQDFCSNRDLTVVRIVAQMTSSSIEAASPAPAAPATAGASKLAIVGAFAALYIIWGSTYLAIRVAVETLPPLLMARARLAIAGVLLYAYLRLRGGPPPTPAHWRSSMLAGGLLLLGGNSLVVWAEQTVPSGVAALLVATVPLWIVLLNSFWPGGSRP